MAGAGAVGFTDDGDCVASAGLMAKALTYIKPTKLSLMQHCQEASLTRGASMHSGSVATRLGLGGWPRVAEEIVIERDVRLNRGIGCRYHVQHLSSGGSVEIVRRARAEGQPVSAEVSPHHLLLTDESCRGYDTNFKMNPPLRTARDIKACIEGIKDGTVDCLATDHAPHLAEEKELEFQHAPFGIIGLECALPLYIKALIEPGHIDWMKLIELMTIGPARVVSLKKGTLAEGADADITVIDPALAWTVDVEQFKSKSRNCPYDGWSLKGRAIATIVAGDVKWSLGQA